MPGDNGMFLEKAARAVAEVQPHVSTVADALVFLEVLGYTDRIARQNGCKDMFDLASKVHSITGHYDVEPENTLYSVFGTPIPSLAKRTAEAFSIGFPSMISWTVLIVFGVSLWLAGGLPLSVTTAFLIGVFVALAVTGALRSFGRLFGYYDGQGNLFEMKRVLRRYYGLLGFSLVLMTLAAFSVIILENIPLALAMIFSFSTITLSLQLAAYMVIYSRKEIRQVFVSYVTASAVLILIYYLSADFVSSLTIRYFFALSSAFIVLIVPAIYYHHTLFRTKSESASLENGIPSFYVRQSVVTSTIPSRFEIQLWEILPFGIYGVFFIGMLFGDRIISWIYNPVHLIDGVMLPVVFNATYDIGADLALLVLFPSMLIQYVILSPVYDQIYNLSLNRKVSQMNEADEFLSNRYRKMLGATLLASTFSALLMILLLPYIVPALNTSSSSLEIFYVASVSNILMSVFGGNALFLMFINKIKPLAAIAIVGTILVMGGGVVLAQNGFQNIVFAYLGESIFAVITTSILLRRNLGKAVSIHFARYV